MIRNLSRSALVAAAASLLLAGCSATPDVTSAAPGKVYEINKTEPVPHHVLAVFGWGLTVGYAEQTRFWVFAEDGTDFQCDPPNAGSMRKPEPYFLFAAPGNALTEFAKVNGFPVAVHLGHLLVGIQDFGPVADGETVEFTADGIFVNGQYRGAIPGSVPAVAAEGS